MVIVFLVLVFGVTVHALSGKAESQWDDGEKTIEVSDGGLVSYFSHVTEHTVGGFLESHALSLMDGDTTFPFSDAILSSGTHILIVRAHDITIMVDGNEKHMRTQSLSVEEALRDAGVIVDEDDIVKPGRETLVVAGMRIDVTRVRIEEQTAEKPIAYEKKVNGDDSLSWRKTIVTTKGENGTKRLTYRVSLYDDKEINRRLVNTETIKEPTTEVTTQGTFVKTGKSHQGGASWYAFTGTMAAANPWLPMGSFVRVTNLENGKNVIVKINDRGPFVPGRIIDLDKVAFQKIASIGAGVITVKMEEIIN